MNTEIKTAQHAWDFSTQPKDKVALYKILGKPWEVIAADLFTINNSNFLCIVHYHIMFQIVE